MTILENALNDLHDLLGLDGEPEYKRFSVWPKAIPQYVVGYEKYLDHMKQIEDRAPRHPFCRSLPRRHLRRQLHPLRHQRCGTNY